MNFQFVYLGRVGDQFDFSCTLYPVSYGTVVKGNALPLPGTEPRSIVLVLSGTMHYCVVAWQVRSLSTHDLRNRVDK
jgi:hypothetical protein